MDYNSQNQNSQKKKKTSSPKKKRGNRLKHWAALTGVAIQMGVTIYLFVMLGKWLDGKYANGGKPFLIVCTLLGVGVSLYAVLKQVNKLNDE